MVTGSSKGIGRSIAEHLARAGARVVISSRKEAACQEVAQAITEAGGDAIAIPCNVGKQEQVINLVQQTEIRLGPVDILICNAAANPHYGELHTIDDPAYQKTMNTNVLSVLRLCGLVLPGMAKYEGGVVIIVGSIAELKGTPNIGAYAISKAAVGQMARSLATEWGKHNIRINCILPGLVKTDFAKALWDTPEAEQRAKNRIPLGRLGEPDDIGPAAVFLASRAGSWITGQSFIIDGGNTITG